MSLPTIKKFLTKTSQYINADAINNERAAHHNYVVNQKICHALTCLDDMTSDQIASFDKDCLSYLKRLDNALA